MFSIIIGFILTISILVFIHEYGHYFVAKTFGVKIEEFSIGFGKELFARVDKHGTRWKICLLPLGGFVKMHKDEARDNSKLRDPTEFYAKSPYQRFLIILAGPLANFLFAFMVLSSIYYLHGKYVIPAVVEKILLNSPAEEAGILPGDKIVKIRDHEIKDFSEFKQNLIINPTLPLLLTLERNGHYATVIINSYLNSNDDPRIGIQSKVGHFVRKGLIKSLSSAAYEIYDISILTFKMLGQMVLGDRKADDMRGIITIAKESGNILHYGIVNFLLFLAMISINLGLVNILPIPVLDGGHLLFTIYEIITKKPLSLTMQNIFNKIGLAIIIFLIIISTTNDIKSLL